MKLVREPRVAVCGWEMQMAMRAGAVGSETVPREKSRISRTMVMVPAHAPHHPRIPISEFPPDRENR